MILYLLDFWLDKRIHFENGTLGNRDDLLDSRINCDIIGRSVNNAKNR